MKEPIFYLFNSISHIRGGGTRNVLARAKLLREKRNCQIYILTLNFDPDYDFIRSEMIRLNLLHPEIPILNMFEYLSHKTNDDFQTVSADDAPRIDHPPEEEGVDLERVPETNGYRLYRNGTLVKYKEYDDDGRLNFIDHFDENRILVRREHFDMKGRARQIVDYDRNTANPRQKRFLDETGQCFLEYRYNPKIKKCIQVDWFDRDGALIDTFPNVRALKLHWLHKIADRYPKAIFQTDVSKKNTDYVLLKVNHPHVVKVKMFHSLHLQKPYTYGAPLKEVHGTVLEQADQFDAVVFTTDLQKKDVERQFGPRSTFHVIPHCAPRVQPRPDVERDPFTCVYVGRFVELKNVDHAIRAFKRVVKKVPQAKLEIWGYGAEEINYQKLIRNLELEQHVKVCGITHDAIGVFSRAAFSVLPSSEEAFPLTIIESKMVGTPVIAYEVNYGPRAMIRNGVDGLLVKPHDIGELADAMVKLFTEPKLREALGQEARKTPEILSEEQYVDRWMQVYESALRQSDQRVRVKKPICALDQMKWNGTSDMHIAGSLTFKQDLRDEPSLSLYIRERSVLVDEYFPLSTERLDANTFSFRGEFSVHPFTREGTWDMYVSCSIRNQHHFIRIPKGTVSLPERRKISDVLLEPYATIHGNISIEAKPRTSKPNFREKLTRWKHRILENIPSIRPN
ncbi:glycosyltransferase [Planifilum fimeticola]